MDNIKWLYWTSIASLIWHFASQHDLMKMNDRNHIWYLGYNPRNFWYTRSKTHKLWGKKILQKLKRATRDPVVSFFTTVTGFAPRSFPVCSKFCLFPAVLHLAYVCIQSPVLQILQVKWSEKYHGNVTFHLFSIDFLRWVHFSFTC